MRIVEGAAWSLALCAILPTCAWADDWKLSSKVEIETTSWEDDLGDKGRQSAGLISLSAVGGDFSAGLTTGYVEARAESDIPALNGDIHSYLDTVVSASWRGWRTDLGGRAVTFSVDGDVSLPTGKESLSGLEKNVVFDPLLARFDRYGEGLNASGAFAASWAISKRLSLATGLRYIYSQSYQPDADAALSIDPADTSALYLRGVWGDGRSMSTFGIEVSEESVATREGTPIFKRGAAIVIDTAFAFQVNSKINATLMGSYSTRNRDKRRDEVSGAFTREQKRRDGDAWVVAATFDYSLGDQWRVSLLSDYARVGDSEIDDANFSYLPARERWRLGIEVAYALSPTLSIEGGAKYLDYRDQGSQLLLPLEATGGSLMFSLSKRW